MSASALVNWISSVNSCLVEFSPHLRAQKSHARNVFLLTTEYKIWVYFMQFRSVSAIMARSSVWLVLLAQVISQRVLVCLRDCYYIFYCEVLHKLCKLCVLEYRERRGAMWPSSVQKLLLSKRIKAREMDLVLKKADENTSALRNRMFIWFGSKRRLPCYFKYQPQNVQLSTGLFISKHNATRNKERKN
jgi:hypothetical protein